MEEGLSIVLALIVILLILSYALSNYIKKKRINFVLENSLLLKEIDDLNKDFYYETIYDGKYHHRCNSKQEFDRKRLDDIASEFVHHNLSQLQEQIKRVYINRNLEVNYNNELRQALQKIRKKQDSLYDKYKFFYKIEENLVEEKLIKIQTELYLTVKISYTSPQGRNHYDNEKTYNTREIKSLIEKDTERKIINNSIKHERSLMTDSLRYDILKRDNFRCQICGATQEDGVKLHVDHIKPISKGGKTEPSNLRTLCERCNFGKSAKYDKNGMN